MTARGAEKLRQELQHRTRELRPKNAEFHAAREQHGFNEGRISEIEGKLGSAQIIDVTQLPLSGKVVFGATVEVADVDSGEESRYQIVGEDEVDVKGGLISLNSPIARALIGKTEGDVVQVQTPQGTRELEIIKVHYI
jgi:transcription elongation factor GreA